MINLEEIKSRYQATTVAPSFAVIKGRDQTSGSSFIMTGINESKNIAAANRGEDLNLKGATNSDIDFIAHARQDILALVAEVERLQIVLEAK